MIASMTGYARAQGQYDWGVLTWELRSVNHRYLEIGARLPEELREMEPAVRERVTARLGRGKVECQLRFEACGMAAGTPVLDEARARALIDIVHRTEALMEAAAPVTAMDLMRWPGVVGERGIDVEPVAASALALLDEALDDLRAARQREGERLAQLIGQRCDALAAELGRARALLPQIRSGLRERLRQRLAELDVEAEPGRLEQELAIQLQKIDVDEELDRLAGHIDEVRAVLQRDEPVGRRLDFLMQELNREANTLGSKSVSADTTRISVEMKVLIEQMREQVQNIE